MKSGRTKHRRGVPEPKVYACVSCERIRDPRSLLALSVGTFNGQTFPKFDWAKTTKGKRASEFICCDAEACLAGRINRATWSLALDNTSEPHSSVQRAYGVLRARAYEQIVKCLGLGMKQGSLTFGAEATDGLIFQIYDSEDSVKRSLSEGSESGICVLSEQPKLSGLWPDKTVSRVALSHSRLEGEARFWWRLWKSARQNEQDEQNKLRNDIVE